MNTEHKEFDYKPCLAKGTWKDAEAACYFHQIDPLRFVQKNNFSYEIYITHDNAQQLLKTINTWGRFYAHGTGSPFFYIDTAIQKGIEIPQQLLSDLCEIISHYTENDKTNFISSYPYIAKKLNIKTKNPLDTKNQSKKPLADKTKSSLYKMILGMAVDKYDYDPLTRNSATGSTNKNSIKNSISETLGIDLDEEVIRDHLRDAAKQFPPIKTNIKKS